MNDPTQLARLASMAHALRPDWPTKSLLTYLHANHTHRPFRDLAVALAWIAADNSTKTPARLEENGPWWQAVNAETPPPPTPTPTSAADLRCRRCGQWVTEDDHTCAPVGDYTAGVQAAKAAMKR